MLIMLNPEKIQIREDILDQVWVQIGGRVRDHVLVKADYRIWVPVWDQIEEDIKC